MLLLLQTQRPKAPASGPADQSLSPTVHHIACMSRTSPLTMPAAVARTPTLTTPEHTEASSHPMKAQAAALLPAPALLLDLPQVPPLPLQVPLQPQLLVPAMALPVLLPLEAPWLTLPLEVPLLRLQR